MLRIFVLIISTSITFNVLSKPQTLQYLQLKNHLDRPNDGYCVDVVGSGRYIRLDMPLTAHNCKGPQVYHDEVVQYRNDQTLYFPMYKSCITVMGVNDKALSGNALMLKKCGVETPFLNAKRFQKFQINKNGQVQLANSQLCLTAGLDSHTTYTTEHKWRNLFMGSCKEVSLKHSTWHFIVAGH